MKKPHVLNRSMFNRGGTSAYGRGITSNLVTEEQRQRFNYGGRVGLLTGGNYGLQYGRIPPVAFEEIADVTERIYTTPRTDDNWWNMYAGDDTYQYVVPEGSEDAGEIVTRNVVEEIPEPTEEELQAKAIAKDIKNEPENRVVPTHRLTRLQKEMNAGASDDPPAEVMTDSDWMDLLGPTEEQKKRTKGEAQLGLAAGALDVFSQPSIAKGMKAASPHLLNLGKTATADQKARDKAILQGKVLSKVYKDRAGAKGEADLALQKYKDKQTDDPVDVYKATLNLAATKDVKNVLKDDYRAAALFNAKGINAKILKGAKGGKDGMKADEATLAAAEEGDVFLLDGKYSIISNGQLEDITVEELLRG